MKRIAVIGTGYVGLVSGACLSDFGNNVTCVDCDPAKIGTLKKGGIPIFEPGLEAVVARNAEAGRLDFTTDAESAIWNSDIVFIAVGTPAGDDGSADLVYMEAAARDIGRFMNSYKVIVDKSTVPIGTGRKVRSWISEELGKRGERFEFDIVSNPEFLREGSAVYDFMHPDRVVIGYESARAAEAMRSIYRTLYLNEVPFIETGLESAEMIKYASNAFLAVKISFINEIANLCDEAGADVRTVATAMGKDGRIGPKFLHPGPGFGGSCFPKDTRSIADTARKFGVPLKVVEAAIEANDAQIDRMMRKIDSALGTVNGKTVAVLGLAFKQNTDDIRYSPAMAIVERIIARGGSVRAFDPAAMAAARKRLEDHPGDIAFCRDEYDAAEGSDALVILTEWNQFRNLDLSRMKALLALPVLLDLRNLYERPAAETLGFSYWAVGK